MNFRLSRRKFLTGTLVAGAGVLVDMRLLEPRWLRIHHVDVALPTGRTANPFRILHISDLHSSKDVPLSFIKKAIERGLEQNPDIVCITGDLISHHIPDKHKYADCLRMLSAAAPCYACTGNHDGGDWVRPYGGYADLTQIRSLLDQSNIELLFNASKRISVNGSAIELVGLGDYWANDAHPEQAFPKQENPSDACRLVLSHNPDSKMILNHYAWDLMLCGHTHGGQLVVPFYGTPFAPVSDHRYVHGLNPWKQRLIYTTSGIGNLHSMRANCRPEVAILNVA